MSHVSRSVFVRVPLLLVACWTWCMLSFQYTFADTPTALTSPPPGSKQEITLSSKCGTSTLTVVQIPAGHVFQSPQGGVEEGKGAQVTAYSFSDREITVGMFDTWAASLAKESLRERINTFAFEASLREAHDHRRKHPNEYIVFWATPQEAATVTLAFNEALLASSGASARSIVRKRFRLPTANEWRHAMSVGSANDSRNINPWPKYPEGFTVRERGMCEENWVQCGGREGFSGTPSQIAWLIEESGGPATKIREIVDLFTRSLLVGREQDGKPSWLSSPDPASEKEKVDSAPPNRWGIYGAHRCYPEWVLAIDSQTEATDLWRRFEEGRFSDDDAKRQALQLCGAGCIAAGKDASGQDDVSQLMDLFLWKTTRVRGESTTCCWQEAADGEISIDRNATFRVVLVDTLSDAWIAVVRQQLFGSTTVEEVDTTSQQLQASVALLSGNPSRDAAIIDAYAAIASYQFGEKALAGGRLGEAVPRIAPAGKKKVDYGDIFGNRRKSESAESLASSPQAGEQIFLAATCRLMAKDGTLPVQKDGE